MKKSLATLIGVATLALAVQGLAAKRQTNRQVMDHLFEIIDGKKLDKLAEIEAPDLTFASPMGVLKGPEQHQQMLTGFKGPFPNSRHQVKRCVEAGDLISCQGRWIGDHTGPMTLPDGKVVPPTQKHVELDFLGFAQIKNGKVVDLQVSFDMMSFMQQLGLMPPPPAKTASR